MAKKTEETFDDTKGTEIVKEEVLQSGADFVEFSETNREFEGVYTGETAKREKDKGDQKAGDLMGFVFENENGLHIVGAASSIQKTMEKVSKGDTIKFTWLEKVEMESGKTFNRFKIVRTKKA